MTATLILAWKEFRDGLRNHWVVGATLLLAGLAFAIVFLGSTPVGMLGVKPLAVTVVSLASLSIFILPLIALLLTYDAIVGDIERGLMLLLLTYPVTRVQIVLGKFLGHVMILTVATAIGYGSAGGAAMLFGYSDAASGWAFLALISSSVLLGAVFIVLGYLVSVSVRERGTAAGLAVVLWLSFVLLFDLAVLEILAASRGVVGETFATWVLLANPTDVYRLFNLTSFDNVRQFSGMSGTWAEEHFSPAVLLGTLVAWVAAPLGLTVWRFRHLDI